jgi:sensor domain CHASE-containing protein
MSDQPVNYHAERLHQLVLMGWGILAGMFIVVLFGVLFVLHLQMDRIEKNALIDDSYNATVQALQALENGQQ